MRKLLLYATLLLLTQCSKCKEDDPSPKEPTLPAETQSGQQTLGFKANGTVYAASGVNQTTGSWTGSTAADRFYFSASPHNKSLFASIRIVLRGDLSDGQQFQTVNSTDIPVGRNYSEAAVYLSTSCDYDEYVGARLLSGHVTLTRFDGGARVAAGRFQLTLVKAGCDTLRLTDGRFDVTF